jgi:hypothetical protein
MLISPATSEIEYPNNPGACQKTVFVISTGGELIWREVWR